MEETSTKSTNRLTASHDSLREVRRDKRLTVFIKAIDSFDDRAISLRISDRRATIPDDASST